MIILISQSTIKSHITLPRSSSTTSMQNFIQIHIWTSDLVLFTWFYVSFIKHTWLFKIWTDIWLSDLSVYLTTFKLFLRAILCLNASQILRWYLLTLLFSLRLVRSCIQRNQRTRSWSRIILSFATKIHLI